MRQDQQLAYQDLQKQIQALTEDVERWKAGYQELSDNVATEQRKAREAFATRLLYEQLLIACSPVLLANTEKEEALTETLYEFLVATDANRVYLCKNFTDSQTGQLYLRQTHEMCALHAPSTSELPLMQYLPYETGLERWRQELSHGRAVFGTAEEIPQGERFYLTARETLSILILPIWVEGHWYGFIGIDDINYRRAWKREDVELLQMGVDLIGSYIGRERAERALQESEAKYRTLIEQSSDAIFLIYGNRFELVNHRFEKLFGISQEDANASDFTFTNVITSRKQDVIPGLSALSDSEPEKTQRPPYEFVARDKNGNKIYIELTMSYPIYKKGLATQGIIRDITERKRMEEETRQAYIKIQQYADELATKIQEEQRQREIATILAEVVSSVSLTFTTSELLDHILVRLQQLVPFDEAAVYLSKGNCLVLEAAHGGKATFTNDRMSIDENILFQEMQDTKSFILVTDTHQDTRQQLMFGTEETRAWIGAPLLVAQEILGYLAVHRHLPNAYKNSDAKLVQAFAHQVTQTIHNARLFTELKETQAQLVQRERLAALGQMSVTVAHELRNPLMSLRMGIEYLTFDLPEDASQQRAASLVEANIDRIVRVVENILFVARSPKRTLTSGSLQSLIESELSHWDLKMSQKQISGRLDLADDLPPIYIDHDQIERVLSNIIGNSVDALDEGGELYLGLHNDNKNGKQIITISDTGAGISEEDQAKIFEPFFTTKSRGTGLGLAIVKQIVEGHDGEISVWSEPGHGTKFTIALPQTG